MDFKKFFLASVATLSFAALAACSQTPKAADDKVDIGIIQFAEHQALDAAHDGFIEALEAGGFSKDKVNITFQNAQGDQANLQTMVEKLAGKTDLNFAIATPAAQALLNADPDTPAVFTAVTDPVSANLVDSFNSPGGNMTGTVDANDVSKQIEMLLKVVPTAKTVGIFYNSGEVNSETQAKEATAALKKAGVKVITKTVTSSNDVQQVLESLVTEVDAIYLPTDNTVAATISTIGDVLSTAKIPAMGSDEAILDGVLFTFGVDYNAIGRQAGELAVDILNGKSPSKLPVEKPKTAAVAVNDKMAERLGISLDTITSLTPQ